MISSLSLFLSTHTHTHGHVARGTGHGHAQQQKSVSHAMDATRWCVPGPGWIGTACRDSHLFNCLSAPPENTTCFPNFFLIFSKTGKPKLTNFAEKIFSYFFRDFYFCVYIYVQPVLILRELCSTSLRTAATSIDSSPASCLDLTVF